MENKPKIFYFYSKATKIFSYAVFFTVPVFILVLILHFNIFFLAFTVAVTLFISVYSYYITRCRIEVHADKIIYYGMNDHVFDFVHIDEISLVNDRFIKIVYKGKTTRLTGYINFLSSMPDSDRNAELVDYLNSRIKSYKKRHRF